MTAVKQVTPEDVLRWLETKQRLMRLRWKFVEDFVGESYYVRVSHPDKGGFPALGPTYAHALESALKFASRKQNGAELELIAPNDD